MWDFFYHKEYEEEPMSVWREEVPASTVIGEEVSTSLWEREEVPTSPAADIVEVPIFSIGTIVVVPISIISTVVVPITPLSAVAVPTSTEEDVPILMETASGGEVSDKSADSLGISRTADSAGRYSSGATTHGIAIKSR
ncbi:hypothetical protein HYV58_00575, partial [Candidatus Peregrinibacteria bacterium]|nr:hypothetical protein [Candidatus Peregrinibacteria bacterium]